MITMNVYKKIQERKSRGENISDICRVVGRSRNTVRKYYRMSPSEYLRYTERASERGKVFEPFRDEILELYWLNRGEQNQNSYIQESGRGGLRRAAEA
mgnify:CR=1 FL=1